MEANIYTETRCKIFKYFVGIVHDLLSLLINKPNIKTRYANFFAVIPFIMYRN